jgi:heme/copper-type cytochrome/quinol oxidase subunit 3
VGARAGDVPRDARRRPKKVRLSVELCTLYWHYLLLVWAALFFVLLNTHR